jgi:hypothetical protein
MHQTMQGELLYLTEVAFGMVNHCRYSEEPWKVKIQQQSGNNWRQQNKEAVENSRNGFDDLLAATAGTANSVHILKQLVLGALAPMTGNSILVIADLVSMLFNQVSRVVTSGNSITFSKHSGL